MKGDTKTKQEREFQRKLIQDLKSLFLGCIVMKNDSSYIQGIPDLIILFKDKWATLEVKKDSNASHRPNQDFYIEKMNQMSFSRFIYPENRKNVLKDLIAFFGGSNNEI